MNIKDSSSTQSRTFTESSSRDALYPRRERRGFTALRIRVIFNGADLTTALYTIENMLCDKITSGQYYSLLVNLAAFYPEPVVSSFILDKMLEQTDAELLSMLSLTDDSMLSFLINFYQTLAQQPMTGLSRDLLEEDLSFILTQGKKTNYRFKQKIKRIVELVL